MFKIDCNYKNVQHNKSRNLTKFFGINYNIRKIYELNYFAVSFSFFKKKTLGSLFYLKSTIPNYKFMT